MTNEEIDKRVAVEVMGWVAWSNTIPPMGPWQITYRDINGKYQRDGDRWLPSTSIADAMRVVEKIDKAFKLERDHAGKWWGYVDDDRWYASGNEDTPSAAICLAALVWAEAQGEVKP